MDSEASAADLGYARRREAIERAAAKYALTLAARRIHQQMAQHYAEIVQNRQTGRSNGL